MKKTFRIALLLCLVLGTVFMFAACNKTPATPEETTPEQTTPEETTSPDVTDGPIPLETLNGMTAKQLYEAFIEEYFSSAQFDIELTIEQTNGDGVGLASSIATKIGENAVYYFLTVTDYMDEQPMEVWLIDDVAYVNSYGEKIKRENIGSIDEILGEGALDAVWGSFKQGLPQVYIDALEAAHLYFADDAYYYTITVPVGNMEYDSVTETVYFDENGKVIGVTAIADGYSMRATINSYGKPVTITPPTDADEYVPEFTPVDSLCGMNAAQLFARFEEEYNNCSTYDIQHTRTQRMSGMSPYTCVTTVKGNGNNVSYSYKSSSYSTTEIYLIDDVAYVNVDDKKFRYARVNVADVYGEDFLDIITDMTTRTVSQDYYISLETAQLYYNAMSDLYFYTVTLPAFDENSSSTTETVYFDENGNVVKINSKTGPFDRETLISYNAPVEILPPEDAEEYHVAPFIPQTEEQMYQFYVDACNTIQNAEYLIARAPEITYHRAKEDKYLFHWESDTQYTEQWIIGNKGYIWINRKNFSQTAVNADFLSAFANAEASLHLTPLPKEELQNLECYYSMILARVCITFEYVDESGTLWQYEFEFSDTGHYLDITISKIVDGKETNMRQYIFETDREFQISTPN